MKSEIMPEEYKPCEVAPLVGAWIEIITENFGDLDSGVAPLVGAWIEMCDSDRVRPGKRSRSPRGSVD